MISGKPRVAFLTVRDIRAGEELVWDYGVNLKGCLGMEKEHKKKRKKKVKEKESEEDSLQQVCHTDCMQCTQTVLLV